MVPHQPIPSQGRDTKSEALFYFLTNVLSRPHAKHLFHIELLYGKKGGLHCLPMWYTHSFKKKKKEVVYTPNYHQARYIHIMYIDIYVLDIYQIWPYKYDSYSEVSVLLSFLFHQNHQMLTQSLNFSWKEKRNCSFY